LIREFNYLRIDNAEGYVLIAVYLFICIRVTRITQNPGNICLDCGIDRVKVKGHEKVKIFLNRMKFGGMIGY